MRKTIYVPNQEVWDRVKAEAKKADLSVSQYLLSGEIKLLPVRDIDPQILENLAYIRDQVDRLCGIPEGILNAQEAPQKVTEASSEERSQGGKKKEVHLRNDAEGGLEAKKKVIDGLRGIGIFNPQPKKGKK